MSILENSDIGTFGAANDKTVTMSRELALFESILGKTPDAFLREPVYQVTESEVLEFARQLATPPQSDYLASCESAHKGLTIDQAEAVEKGIDDLLFGAAPVVERQEPVAYMYQHEETGLIGFVHAQQLERNWQKMNPRLVITGPVFASPPSPVAALDERTEFVAWVRREWPKAPLSNVRDLLPKDDPRYGECCDETLQRAWVGWQARACLDKVKEMNQ